MLDLDHGLLPFAPWAAVAFPLLLRLRPAGGSGGDPLAPKISIPFALHWALLSLYGALGAACYGPRYWIPFLPWLALAAVRAGRDHPALRGPLLALGIAATALSVPAALQYPEVWELPPYTGLLRLLTGP
jgi:hypothetical protein